MKTHINHESLALGACYALTHAASVLEDAAILYSHKRASSSFHLAVMAREELGRYNLLSERHQQLPINECIDANELTKYLQPHKNKLLAGQSTVPVPMAPEQLEAWKAAILANDDMISCAIEEEIRARAKKLKPHQVATLHQKRLKAQYVDLDSQTGHWSRPTEISLADAQTLILTVMAEISNALINTQSTTWLHTAFDMAGENRHGMGPFTHRIFAHLYKSDV